MNQTEKAKHNLIESTVKKTVDLGAKLALSFVPGASIAYEVAKLGVSQATAFVQQKQEERITQFHEMLLKPDEKWDEALADACIEAVDYHLLLSACVQDLEDEKTELYAELAKNAAAKNITPVNIRFFTLSLQQLSFSDLEEMRIAYVSKNFSLMDSAGSGNYEKDLSVESANDVQAHGRRMMDLRGFLQENTLNEFGELFTQSCYPSAKLTPGAIGMREWLNPQSPLMTVCYEMEDTETVNFCVHLSEKLRDGGVKIGPIVAIMDNRSLITPAVSLFVIKSKPEQLLKNQPYLQKILNRTCIAILLREDFPKELEGIKSHFKKIITVAGKGSREAAEIVAEQLLLKEQSTTG